MKIRSLYYIHPEIQFPFTRLMTTLMAIELLILGLVLIITERVELQLSQDLSIYFQYGILLVTILAFSALNMILTAKLTHRIAGPLVQIQRVMDKARKGDYSVRAHIRTDDSLHEVARDLNLLLESLEGQEQTSPQSQKQKLKNVETFS